MIHKFCLTEDGDVVKNSPSLVREVLIQSIRNILIRHFDDSRKQDIVDSDERINFCCPYCDDSIDNVNKKRGNVYPATMTYKCYNCGYFTSVLRFFSDHGEIISTNYISDFVVDVTYKPSAQRNSLNISSLIGGNLLKYSVTKEDVFQHYDLVEINDTKCSIGEHLNYRCQYEYWRFGWSVKNQYLYILNIDPATSKIIGMQRKSFKYNNASPKYVTYTLSDLRQELGLEEIEETNKILMNKYSMTYRIFEINFNQPITIFEGPLDSFLYRNSIALCSVNNKPPVSCTKYRYLFDYDKSGISNMIQKCIDGESVFMWGKFLHENKINLPRNKKIDFNDVVMYYHNLKKILPDISNYFSSDKYDMYWI